MMMIQTEKLTRKFGSFTAVDRVDLGIEAGEIFCFLGPNGAGKTTTIKMLCGLLKPTGGLIRIAGKSMQDDALGIRRICGYIPDQPYLYERLTPVEYCLFTADLFRLDRPTALSRMEDYFDLLGLGDYRASLIRELSHGLRQRLLYAATLLHNPQILFVDEPFVGLDPYSIRTIRDLLKDKAREGMTIFLTTHILALAEDMARRVAIIHAGCLVDCDETAVLKKRHANEGTLEDAFLTLTRKDRAP
jgi:ABC-2 type transport system ATP-binding protein